MVIGLGELGGRILDRIRESIGEEGSLLRLLGCGAGDVRERAAPLLAELLRAGRTDRGEPRLDLVLFGDSLELEGDDGQLVRASSALASLIAEEYGSIFPANLPPEQRSVALHVIGVVPGLPSAGAARALSGIAALERWAEPSPDPIRRREGAADASHPLLSRIWLVARQTHAGNLSEAEVVSTCASFALASFGAGLRDDATIGRLLLHPRAGEGRVGFLSIASAEVPEARLETYAALRSSYDALDRLVERVERPADPARIDASIAALHHADWLQPLLEGRPAAACRKLASRISGASQKLPAEIRLGPFESAAEIRERLAPLFAPTTVNRPSSHEETAGLEQALCGLDHAEADIASRVDEDLDLLLESTLGVSTGLAAMPEVVAGLGRISAKLRDEQLEESPAPEPSPEERDPHREEVEEAFSLLPSPWILRGSAAAVGLCVGFATTVIAFALGSNSSPAASVAAPTLAAPTIAGPASAASAMPVPWQEILPWIWGGAAFVLACLGFSWLVGKLSRKELLLALQRRRNALEQLWSRGGAGEAGRQVEAQLSLRRRRTRRSAILSLEDVLARLQAVRRSLHQSRDQLHRDLLAMGVVPAADPTLDDLRPLLDQEGLLHVPLCPPRELGRWAARCRKIADPAVWADRFLEGSWPPGGLRVDVPCADRHRIDALGLQQVAPLRERSIFDDPATAKAAAASVKAFADRAPASLRPPCDPLDPHGDRVRTGGGDTLVIAPHSGLEILEEALAAKAAPMKVVRTSASAARVLFLRSWSGYTTAEIARGAGIDPAELQAEGNVA